MSDRLIPLRGRFPRSPEFPTPAIEGQAWKIPPTRAGVRPAMIPSRIVAALLSLGMEHRRRERSITPDRLAFEAGFP